jgi:hypothetical protein
MIHMILRETFVNLVVRHSGISYPKKVGKEFDPTRMMKLAAQRKPYSDNRIEVTVTRLIVERKSGFQMPHTHTLHGQFMASMQSADYETRNFFSIGPNNHGNYLLEIPENTKNVKVAFDFLKWLDEHMLPVPPRITPEKVEVGHGQESD